MREVGQNGCERELEREREGRIEGGGEREERMREGERENRMSERKEEEGEREQNE